MQISQITFSILKTTPLYAITRNTDDQYANIKPQASCTVTFADGECDTTNPNVVDYIATAYGVAQSACFDQLAQFHADFIAAVGK